MAKKRNGRQDAIRDIVRNKNIRTQRMLVDELKACGYDCTQATVSRDIADMGLRKLPEGVYVLAEDLHLQRMVSELVIEVLRTENLVLIKAQPGTASGIAAAVDAAELPDVLGSLAGNDTILVIARTAEDGVRLEGLTVRSAAEPNVSAVKFSGSAAVSASAGAASASGQSMFSTGRACVTIFRRHSSCAAKPSFSSMNVTVPAGFRVSSRSLV